MVLRLKAVPEVEFRNVLLWQRKQPAGARIRKNIRKHGLLYIPWRIGKLLADRIVGPVKEFIRSFLLAPSRQPDLASACSACGIALHRTADAHAPETMDLIGSFGCDLFLLCGTGIVREPLISLPRLGTINLHQGEVPFYRGAPPGFWELWNGEEHTGVTVHFVDRGIDTGDVILQELVPILPYDDHARLRDKLAEISLSLYPRAVQQIAQGRFTRVRQQAGAGASFTFPTLTQTFQLWFVRRRLRWMLFLRNSAKKLLFLTLLMAIALRDRLLRMAGRDVLSVLYYHRVTDLCRDGMTIGRAAFEEQIRFLTKRYRILDPRDLPRWLARDRTGMGQKALLITFDDGYEDNYRNAFPILSRYNCPALFFVSTGYIGTSRQFDHDHRMQPRVRFGNMSWAQVREMQQQGMTIGIHSHDHLDLGSLSHADAVRQIELSISEFADRAGQQPVFMSYPFGGKRQATPLLAEHLRRFTAVKALFCAYGNKNISPIDPYAINRVNVGANDDDLLIFWCKTEGGLETLVRPKEAPWPAPGGEPSARESRELP